MAYDQNLVCFNTFGQEKSWSIETYEKNDGYQAWRKILAGKMTPEQVNYGYAVLELLKRAEKGSELL